MKQKKFIAVEHLSCIRSSQIGIFTKESLIDIIPILPMKLLSISEVRILPDSRDRGPIQCSLGKEGHLGKGSWGSFCFVLFFVHIHTFIELICQKLYTVIPLAPGPPFSCWTLMCPTLLGPWHTKIDQGPWPPQTGTVLILQGRGLAS